MAERNRLDWDDTWTSLRHIVHGREQNVPTGTMSTTGEYEVDQRDAFIVKNMWNTGASVRDIAFVLECSTRTVRRCIDRNFEATEKKRQIADRQDKFFPDTGTGNYKAGVVRVGDAEVNFTNLSDYSSPTEAAAAALQQLDRLSEQLDRMDIERLINQL